MNGSQRKQHQGEEIAIAWNNEIGAARGNRHTIPVSAPKTGIQFWEREITVAWRACGAFEWVALSYLALSSVLIVLFEENLAHPVKLIGLQVLVAGVILLLCRVEAGATAKTAWRGESFTSKFWHFWRHWYPHLFILFCFEELAVLVHLVLPEWQDAKLIAADYWLTGVHPSIWLEQFATPARNEFMQFAYLSYFTYLLVVGGVLYYRRDWRGYWSVMTYSMAGYCIGYVIAIFFPIESPWFSMAGAWHGELRGGTFTAVINFIEHYGRVRGAAFPSEHVAGATAAVWGAWRHRRWLFWVLLPLFFCMCFSTVWGRYHYVVDVLAGMITGTLGYIIGSWIIRRQNSRIFPSVSGLTESNRAG
jgi:membrane-associated phospholipid phosphatase